jgi:hypothetical protein
MPDADDSLQRFYRRLWQQRILPSLSHEQQDKQLHRTRQTARWASAGGRFIDSLLGLRGRPFTRALTSLGVDLSLPKTWDWNWVSRQSDQTRQRIDSAAQAETARLENTQALALFGLDPSASLDDLRAAWHAAAHRWHPDRARTDEQRCQAHTRFITLQATYTHLCSQYKAGKLPSCSG